MTPPMPEPEIDQGMGYELAALIARPPVLTRAQLAFPVARVVLLAQGFALTPLTDGLTAALAAGSGRVPPETGFTKLSPGLYALLLSTSNVGPIGLFEADYVATVGWQTAAVWRTGELAYGPEMLHRTEPFPATGGGPFGGALRTLGARSEGRHDEFVAVGLGRVRRTEDWA
jgi:hypothetical protein